MAISKHLLSHLLFVVFIVHWAAAVAAEPRHCVIENTYGYVYNGTSYTPSGPISLTETGFFTADRSGSLSGEGTLAFYFANFGGHGPLWLLIHEVQSRGIITPDANDACTGTADFMATGTVIKTSNATLVPEGTVLFADSPRSIAYTISGLKNEIVDLVSTSPGTIASGTAHKRGKER